MGMVGVRALVQGWDVPIPPYTGVTGQEKSEHKVKKSHNKVEELEPGGHF